MGLKFDSDEFFTGYLREIERLRTEGEKSLRALGDDVAQRMVRKGPRDPSSSSHGIDSTTVTDGRNGTSYFVDVGPEKDAFYLAFNEYGTGHQPARPFLRPAVSEAVAAWKP